MDVDRTGSRMGITFGPALGVNVYDSCVKHVPTGVTSSGNAHRCLHCDTWEQVVGWNNLDPYVYEQCIENGCTKAIPIDFSGISVETPYEYIGNGDGLSAISIPYWFVYNGTLSGLTGSEVAVGWYNAVNSTAGGWGASRLRAFYNGADNLTDKNVANGGTCSDVSLFTSENRFLNCFPEVLRDAIGERRVNYCVTQYTHADSRVSYDKLWAPAISELCSGMLSSSGSLNPNQNHSADGATYKKFANVGPVKEGSVNSNVVTYLRAYCEYNRTVSPATYFVRSIANSSYPFGVCDDGNVCIQYCTSGFAIAPCFTLSR